MTTVSPLAASAAAPKPTQGPAAPAAFHIPTAPSAPTAAASHRVELDPRVIAHRIHNGRIAEYTEGKLPDGAVTEHAPKYFETYDQLKATMYALQKAYPDLVEIKDIGDGYQKSTGKADRDVLALVITNKKITTPKPAVVDIAGVHAREIANPELLMTWAKQLLAGYGRDPQATSLLDSRVIHLVPMVNPDGHAFIERAYSGGKNGDYMRRKNADGQDGTDINRNFPYHWGGPGAGTSPYDETYRGASAGSEPETKAVDAYVAAVKPKVFIDWHSYSRLDMFPWGDTKKHAADYKGLKAVSDKFSTFNHYSSIQSIDLYPTTGTTDDNAYGTYGTPSWTVETGDSFLQDDKEYAETLRDNLPVLQYSAQIADDPYKRALGPEVADVLVDPSTRQVSARIDGSDATTKLAGAELVFTPDAAPGSGIQLNAADGDYDSRSESVHGDLSKVPGISPKPGQLVYVRARNADGEWGALTAQWLNGPLDTTPA